MRLGVNIDHIATVRQARRGRMPDPVDAALICERAGANSIVCHLREDRRHIQDEDVARLLKRLKKPLNLEMSMAPEIVTMAMRLAPYQVTLVPERRQELTTEGGLDAMRLWRRLRQTVRAFHQQGIAVSLFVDPVRSQLAAAADTGVRLIELHTGRYAHAARAGLRARELAVLRHAAAYGRGLGLAVAAGHGLDYENTPAVARIPEIEELNIGFSIISRAVFAGIRQAVREMKQLMPRRHA